MQKLGLENKLVQELYQKLEEKEAIITEQSTLIDELRAQIKEKEKIIQSINVTKIVDSIESYSIESANMLKRIFAKMQEDGYEQFADYLLTELNKKDEFIKQIIKELNFLSLSATKKSEKYVPRDENGLAEGQTIDKDNPEIKHPKKEDAKARGNNGAKHDQHNEVPCEDKVVMVYPSGTDENDTDRYVVVEKLRRTQLVYTTGHFLKRVYELVRLYDKKTGKIICAKMPDCPLPESMYGSNILADLAVSKYAWHQSITTIANRYRSEGFNANEGTLDGLMMKLCTSLFFRNLDRTLYLAIIEDDQFMIDESYLKSRVDFAKLDKEFIRKCFFWGMLAVNLKLARFHCDNGSRKNEVGYSLVRPIDHPSIAQSDGYSCYKNIENGEEFNLIQRIGCFQHTRRRYDGLEDPRAQKIMEMFRSIYHLDTLRKEQAIQDALSGKEWTLEDHVNWRKNKMLPAFLEILEYINSILATESTGQPLSKLFRNAMNYTLNEAEALKRVFTCGVICDLDQSQIERINRVFSYLRKNSQAYGSMKAAENQAIFISLIESAKLHHLNVQEYMHYLLQQMATIKDSIVKDKNSKDYELYRNMLPDRYAQTHKTETKHYDLPAPQEGPLNPGAKRCGYKKRRIPDSIPKPDPDPDPDVG